MHILDKALLMAKVANPKSKGELEYFIEILLVNRLHHKVGLVKSTSYLNLSGGCS